MIPTEELALGQFRLLEVDNAVVLPTHTHVRVIITALMFYIVGQFLL